ncbi:uncharacterized protein [Drosophila suzukii]|uniref:Uncharacterized protein isoform X5 n=1 Tax=Drosophila suzukii TaxID=28584 RepID=A0ABM4TYA4_DROSZ
MHLAWSHCQAVGIFPKHAAQPKAMRLEGVGAELGARFFCWNTPNVYIFYTWLTELIGIHSGRLTEFIGIHSRKLELFLIF